MQTRYFIGLELPDHIAGIISDAQARNVSSNKLMKPIQPHITLLDPNILMDVSPIYLLPKLQRLAKKHLPMKIKLGQVSGFDDRVLHITVESPGLIELHRQISMLLPKKIRDSYMVGREFTPHVTLAQAKPKQKLASDIKAAFIHRLSDLLPADFTCNHLSKFSWQSPKAYKAEPLA